MAEDWRQTLSDVAAVTVTPFAGRELDAIDIAALEANLGFLVSRGVRLLVAGGNTGEFATLTPSERLDIVRAHVAVADGRARVIAGVGFRLDEALDLGRQALDAGASGLLVHEPPIPYSTDRGLTEYYLRLARGLSDAPLILYLRDRLMSVASLERIVREAPSVVGIKVGVPDVMYMAELRNIAPDVTCVCAVGEEFAIDFWQGGATGFTSGVANFLPTHPLAAFAELRLGRFSEARAIISRLLPIEKMRGRRDGGNNVAVIKAAMDILGLSGGGVRPPLSGLLPRERVDLARILRGLAD
jgi:4-hydroxy-tetrahydrodipicolinate synthase